MKFPDCWFKLWWTFLRNMNLSTNNLIDNLFLLQNPLNQRFEYFQLATAGYFSNMIFFTFDRNYHLFIPFPRFLCSWNCRKSSSFRKGYWAFLHRTFLLILFFFLRFSSWAIQYTVVNYTLVATICINFEQNKSRW